MSELQHHGVKGMKWGVRKDNKSNKPHKSTTKRDDVIVDAVNFALGQPTKNYTLLGKKRRTELTKGEKIASDVISLAAGQPMSHYTVTGKKRRTELTDREKKIERALRIAIVPLQG